MKNQIHPKMLELLTSLFPDTPPEESFERVSKAGKKCLEDLDFLKKKKDADSSPAPSIQLNLK